MSLPGLIHVYKTKLDSSSKIRDQNLEISLENGQMLKCVLGGSCQSLKLEEIPRNKENAQVNQNYRNCEDQKAYKQELRQGSIIPMNSQVKIIFGKDTRVPYPYGSTSISRAIARTRALPIPDKGVPIGTAFLIYGGLVITSGHNNTTYYYQKGNRTFYYLSFIEFNVPISNQHGEAVPSSESDRFQIYRNTNKDGELIPDENNPYTPYFPSKREDFDWCVAKLKDGERAVEKYGFLRLTDKYEYMGPYKETVPVQIAGYGRVLNGEGKRTSKSFTLQIAEGEITRQDAILLQEQISSESGNSGSPVFKKNKDALVVGIHVGYDIKKTHNWDVGMKSLDLTNKIRDMLKVDWIVDNNHPDSNEEGTVTNPFLSIDKAFKVVDKNPQKNRIGVVSGSSILKDGKFPKGVSCIPLGPGACEFLKDLEL